MNITEAAKVFSNLVNRVYREGISVDLERDNEIIARLTPAEPTSALSLGELNSFLSRLPSLGDDVEEFAHDIQTIRAEFPAEATPWD